MSPLATAKSILRRSVWLDKSDWQLPDCGLNLNYRERNRPIVFGKCLGFWTAPGDMAPRPDQD